MKRDASVTIADAIDEFLVERMERVSAGTLKEATVIYEREILAVMERALGGTSFQAKDNMKLVEQIAKRLQAWLDKFATNHSSEYVCKHLRVFSCFFKWCHRKGYVIMSPSKLLRRPPKRRVPVLTFSHEEYLMIKEATAGTMWHWFTICSYRTGMSPVDVCLLRRASINWESMIITAARHKLLCRGDFLVTIPILPGSDLHEHLVALWDHPVDMWPGPEYISPELASQYLSRNRIRNIFSPYIKILRKLGIQRKTARHWRHTFLSGLANSGINTALGCKMSGHTNPHMFTRYVLPDVDAMRQALMKSNEFMERKHNAKIQIEDKKTTE